MEGDDMKDQASLIAQMENLDYGRYRDQVSDYNTELDRLQNRYDTERDYDYGKWADNRDFGYGQYIDDRNYQYQQGRDQVSDEQWQKEFDFALQQYNDSLKKTSSRSSGGGGGNGGNGGGGGEVSETEEKMDSYVKNMLNNATSSRFNPEQVINANSSLTKEEKEGALEILDAYISGGAMKTGGKI